MSAAYAELERVQQLIAREPPGADDTDGTVGWLQRLCRTAARVLPASGVGVSVMTDDGAQGMAAASDATCVLIEETQFTMGEGPCLDAYATQRPVLTPDLVDGAMTRWPGYSPAVHDHGVRAVFAFPLQMGVARLGALDVYRHRPGPLSTQALAEAITFAEVAMTILLDAQEQSGHEASDLPDALENRLELHQAQGMVMVALGVSLLEAMVRLRAYAFAHDRRLGDVAGDVVARRLTLERDDA